MKKIFLIIIIALIAIIGSKNLFCQATSPETIAGVKFINPDNEQLKKLGINVKADKIEYFEKKQSSDEQSFIVHKIIITKNSVGGRNYKADANSAIPVFYPRLAVNSFTSGTAVYYSRLDDFSNVNNNADKSNLKDTVTNSYARANNLIAVHIVFEPKSAKKKNLGKNDIYLWYEPTPEFIAALSKEDSEQIAKETDSTNTSKDSTESSFTGNNRQISGAVISSMLYPNPVSGTIVNLKFQLSDNRKISVSIYDINGKKLVDFNQNESMFSGEHSAQLQIDNLEQGMYLLAIVTDKGEKAVQRLIIVR